METVQIENKIVKNNKKINDIDSLIKELKISSDHKYVKMLKKELIEGRIVYNREYWEKYLSWTKQNI